MKKSCFACLILLLLIFGSWGSNAQAGRIVVANDDYTLSNTGFSDPNDPGAFALNVASWFPQVTPGSKDFLAYSNNIGLTQSSLSDVMTGAGYTWTVGTNPSYLNNLSNYDAVFLGGYAADNNILADYVRNGGNVYLLGGTGKFGGAIGEANAWNPFLSQFGLGFEVEGYNGVGSVGDRSIAISSEHPIFSGVDHLYNYNGSDVVATGSNAQVLVTQNGHGLYGAYVSTPEPATMFLFGFGLVALGGVRRRFRKK